MEMTGDLNQRLRPLGHATMDENLAPPKKISLFYLGAVLNGTNAFLKDGAASMPKIVHGVLYKMVAAVGFEPTPSK